MKAESVRNIAAILICALVFLAGSARAAPPLEAYGDLPTVEDMAISASGEFLAVAGRTAGERQVLLLDQNREPRAAFPLDDRKFNWVTWAGDDFAIVSLRDTVGLDFKFTTNKAEVSTAIIVPRDGGKPSTVFSDSYRTADPIHGFFGTRFVNGKWYGYFGGLMNQRIGKTGYTLKHTRRALYAVDLAENRSRQIAPPPPEDHWRDWVVGGDGEVAATLTVSSRNGGWEIENRTGQRIAAGVHPTGEVALTSLGGDGTSVIYSLEDPETARVLRLEVPLAGGVPTPILADGAINRFYIDPANARMLGYRRTDPLRAVLFEPDKQEILNKIYRAFSGLETRVLEWTPGFTHFLVHTSGNGDSGTWFMVDAAALKADPLDYDRPGIGPSDVGVIVTFPYTAADGLKMDGILTLPRGREAKNLPVIVFPHGGPHAHDDERFDWWAQAFAARGYAVFQPNFRGSTGRGIGFRRAGNGEWGRKMQSDISDGLDALVAKGVVDADRACIMGASYGGYAALAGVTLQQGLYRCAVAVAPVSDVRMLYRAGRRRTNHNRLVMRALVESLGDPDAYNAISPRRTAHQADAPILLIHGKDDTIVPFKQSRVMAEALDEAGKPYELVVLDEEDHYLSRAATRKQMLAAAMRFVERHNPPG